MMPNTAEDIKLQLIKYLSDPEVTIERFCIENKAEHREINGILHVYPTGESILTIHIYQPVKQ
jgi:hypothetical protein